MKKLIMAFFCLTLLAGCFPEQNGIVHSSAKDAVSAIESKDTMILVVGKTTCGACEQFQKVMEEVVTNYDIRITEVYMDENAVKDEATGEETYPDMEALEQHIGVIAGTPTVFFIKEGTIKGMFTGSVSYETFKKHIEKNGFQLEPKE